MSVTAARISGAKVPPYPIPLHNLPYKPPIPLPAPYGISLGYAATGCWGKRSTEIGYGGRERGSTAVRLPPRA
eukprot:2032917-Rhodomonas_salina.1